MERIQAYCERQEFKCEKVKGHIDKGNIKADNLAKKGALNGQHIDIQDLLQHKQRYLKNDEIIIFDFKKYLSSKSKEILDKKNRGKSSLHVSKDWSSINLKYIQKKMDPDTKLSVWRNLTNSHIRQFKKTNCSCCDMIVDLEHYIYYCPNTQVYRDFFKDKFYEITKTRCILHDKQMSKYDPRTKIFGLHHDGNMTNTTIKK